MLSDELERGGPGSERAEAFGRALRETLAAKGVSQIELGELLGVGQPTIANWLSGIREPRHEYVFAVEKALSVRPGQLSRFLGYLPPEAVRTVVDTLRAIDDDPRLAQEAKEQLKGIVESLRGKRTARR